MSKNLLILSLFIFSVLKLSAQCSPDNSITKPGFYPNTLPDAEVNVAYDQTIQFKFIKDTTVIVFGQPTAATIDSMHIVSVAGMPPGLSFQLNKVKGVYTPAEVGCAKVIGTPTKGGDFRLKIALVIYAKVSSFPVAQKDTIKNFVLVVKGAGSIPEITNSTSNFYPNPLVADQLNINPNLLANSIKIYSLQGQLLTVQNIDAGQNTIDFTYPKGIYYLEYQRDNQVIREKLLKN